ncbi:hypothetical protein COCOBI_05-5010 [Coccomyxa sp. Obi]|nr:hypothetical protein COCOBI_05-5010 [Coccomyxa sp. Obi]
MFLEANRMLPDILLQDLVAAMRVSDLEGAFLLQHTEDFPFLKQGHENHDLFFDYLVVSAKYEEGLKAADIPPPMPYQPLSGQKRKVLDDVAMASLPEVIIVPASWYPDQPVAAKQIVSGDIETVMRIARGLENPLKTSSSVLDMECVYSTFDKPLESSLPSLLDIHKEQGMGWRIPMKGQFYAYCKYFQKVWAAVNRKRRLQGMQRNEAVAATEKEFMEWKRTRGGIGSVK